MKDKEKQINELVNLLDDKDVSVSHWDYYNDDFNKNYRKELKDVAKIVINAGYRKIDKDSVVLSRIEYEKYQNLKRDVEHSFEYNQGYTDGQIYGSKETAKKILTKLQPYIGGWVLFKELEKEYGIEVEIKE